ncbi:MAG: transposase [Anaerolineales bacterium]|nr:transposase [Anaerolineales bacterium]
MACEATVCRTIKGKRDPIETVSPCREKRERHTQKAQLIADLNTELILATDFCNGKQHDFQLFKQGHYIVAEHIRILADAGYQGVSAFLE